MTSPSHHPNQPHRVPNFDRLARAYRWMEFFSFGPWLALTRGTYLSRIAQCSRALVIGDGDGRFTARLLQQNPSVMVEAIDASAAMLQALQRNAGPHVARIVTHQADARAWNLAANAARARYDLVATHFFLDCLTQTEVEELAARIKTVASPEACWIISEFAVPEGLFGRLIARPLIASLYWAFGSLTGLAVDTLPDHSSALRGAGFALRQRRVYLGGLLVAELWSPAL